MIELQIDENLIMKDINFESFFKLQIKNKKENYQKKIINVYLLLGFYSYKFMMGDFNIGTLKAKQNNTLKLLEYFYLQDLAEQNISFKKYQNALITKFINKKDISHIAKIK